MLSQANRQKPLALMLIYILTLLPLYAYTTNYDVTILGDSISSGYGVKPADNWVNQWSKQLSCNIFLRNLSVQGATTQDGIETLEYFYRYHHTNWLIIELGGNDGLRNLNLDGMSIRLNQLIEKGKANQARVILVATDLPPNYGANFKKRFQSIFRQLAKQHEVQLIQLTFPKDANLIQPDGIHPSPIGHQSIARLMLQKLPNVCSS